MMKSLESLRKLHSMLGSVDLFFLLSPFFILHSSLFFSALPVSLLCPILFPLLFSLLFPLLFSLLLSLLFPLLFLFLFSLSFISLLSFFLFFLKFS